jgi:hypothetical protein
LLHYLEHDGTIGGHKKERRMQPERTLVKWQRQYASFLIFQWENENVNFSADNDETSAAVQFFLCVNFVSPSQ